MLHAVERVAQVSENETSSLTNISRMEKLVNSIYQCIFSRVSVTISKLFSRKKAVLFQIALQVRGDDFFQDFA